MCIRDSALAAWGLASRHWKWWADSRAILLVACSTFPLILFAVPGIAVYDGTRLFLVVFPLWAILVGRGAGALADWCRNRFQRLSPGGILLIPSAILVSSSWGLIATHPCGLSFYNLAVGGPAGAHSLGFETTYWGDSLTRRFLLDVSRHVPENDIIAVFPSLHPLQWTEFPKQVRVWDNGTPRLALYGTPAAASARWVMIFRRKADLPDFLRNTPPGLTPVVEVRRCGVLLAALYRQD